MTTRRVRRREPRIVDPQTHPQRKVSSSVAADFLGVDIKTLYKYCSEELIEFVELPRKVRRFSVTELVAFESRYLRKRKAS